MSASGLLENARALARDAVDGEGQDSPVLRVDKPAPTRTPQWQQPITARAPDPVVPPSADDVELEFRLELDTMDGEELAELAIELRREIASRRRRGKTVPASLIHKLEAVARLLPISLTEGWIERVDAYTRMTKRGPVRIKSHVRHKRGDRASGSGAGKPKKYKVIYGPAKRPTYHDTKKDAQIQADLGAGRVLPNTPGPAPKDPIGLQPIPYIGGASSQQRVHTDNITAVERAIRNGVPFDNVLAVIQSTDIPDIDRRALRLAATKAQLKPKRGPRKILGGGAKVGDRIQVLGRNNKSYGATLVGYFIPEEGPSRALVHFGRVNRVVFVPEDSITLSGRRRTRAKRMEHLTSIQDSMGLDVRRAQLSRQGELGRAQSIVDGAVSALQVHSQKAEHQLERDMRNLHAAWEAGRDYHELAKKIMDSQRDPEDRGTLLDALDRLRGKGQQLRMEEARQFGRGRVSKAVSPSTDVPGDVEKVRAYTRKVKGKVQTVRSHTRSGDEAQDVLDAVTSSKSPKEVADKLGGVDALSDRVRATVAKKLSPQDADPRAFREKLNADLRAGKLKYKPGDRVFTVNMRWGTVLPELASDGDLPDGKDPWYSVQEDKRDPGDKHGGGRQMLNAERLSRRDMVTGKPDPGPPPSEERGLKPAPEYRAGHWPTIEKGEIVFDLDDARAEVIDHRPNEDGDVEYLLAYDDGTRVWQNESNVPFPEHDEDGATVDPSAAEKKPEPKPKKPDPKKTAKLKKAIADAKPKGEPPPQKLSVKAALDYIFDEEKDETYRKQLVGRLARLTDAQIDKLSDDDLADLGEAAEDFEFEDLADRVDDAAERRYPDPNPPKKKGDPAKGKAIVDKARAKAADSPDQARFDRVAQEFPPGTRVRRGGGVPGVVREVFPAEGDDPLQVQIEVRLPGMHGTTFELHPPEELEKIPDKSKARPVGETPSKLERKQADATERQEKLKKLTVGDKKKIDRARAEDADQAARAKPGSGHQRKAFEKIQRAIDPDAKIVDTDPGHFVVDFKLKGERVRYQLDRNTGKAVARLPIPKAVKEKAPPIWEEYGEITWDDGPRSSDDKARAADQMEKLADNVFPLSPIRWATGDIEGTQKEKQKNPRREVRYGTVVSLGPDHIHVVAQDTGEHMRVDPQRIVNVSAPPEADPREVLDDMRTAWVDARRQADEEDKPERKMVFQQLARQAGEEFRAMRPELEDAIDQIEHEEAEERTRVAQLLSRQNREEKQGSAKKTKPKKRKDDDTQSRLARLRKMLGESASEMAAALVDDPLVERLHDGRIMGERLTAVRGYKRTVDGRPVRVRQHHRGGVVVKGHEHEVFRPPPKGPLMLPMTMGSKSGYMNRAKSSRKRGIVIDWSDGTSDTFSFAHFPPDAQAKILDILQEAHLEEPFKSEAQRRWMHANHPEMAKKWERHTKRKKLPKKKQTK